MKFISTVLIMMVIMSCSKTVIVSLEKENDFCFSKFMEKANRSSLVLEDEKVKFSVMNDDSFVYLFISPIGMTLENMRGEGPVLTINPEKTGSFGIKYGSGEIMFLNKVAGQVNFREGKMSDNGKNKITILKGGQISEKLSKDEAVLLGIEAEWKEIFGHMGYFIKLPINKTEEHPYAAQPEENKFEILFSCPAGMGNSHERPERTGVSGRMQPPSDGSMPGGMSGGMPPQGMDRPGIEGPGPGGGSRPTEADNGNEPVKITVKLENYR